MTLYKYIHTYMCAYTHMYTHIYILAVLSLCCHMQAFSSCGEGRLHSSCSVRASHCSDFSCSETQVLGQSDCSSFGTKTYLFHGIWYLPGTGIEPMSPGLPGRFLTSRPPGKFMININMSIHIMFLFGYMFAFLLYAYLRVQLLGYNIALCLAF